MSLGCLCAGPVPAPLTGCREGEGRGDARRQVQALRMQAQTHTGLATSEAAGSVGEQSAWWLGSVVLHALCSDSWKENW